MPTIQIFDPMEDSRFQHQMFIKVHEGTNLNIEFTLIIETGNRNREKVLNVCMTEEEFERLAGNLIKIIAERKYARNTDTDL